MVIKRITIWSIALLVVFSGYTNAAWETSENGPTGPVNSLFVNAKDGNIYASSVTSGVYISNSKGVTWIERNSGMTSTNIRAVVGLNNMIVAGSEGSGIFTTTNNGDSWQQSKTYIGNLNIYGLTVSNNIIFAGTDEAGVYSSTDNSASWKSKNDGNIPYPNPVLTIASSGGKVYVGTAFGGLFESTDNGTSWTDINAGAIKIDVLSICINGTKYFVGTKDGGIFFSDDDGKKWASINSGLKSTYINSIVAKNNMIFVGTKEGGVYFSNNDGKIWYDASSNLPEKEVLSLALDGEYLYAGTATSSILRRKLTEFVAPDVQPPVLTSPLDGTINTDIDMTLTWTPSNGAVSYHIQVSKDQSFASNISFEKDGINNAFSKPPTLEMNTKYFWRVAANTFDGQKKWSEIWSFTTKAKQQTPVQLDPTDKKVDVPNPVKFTWNKTTGTASYFLLVCENDKFDTDSLIIVKQSGLTDTTFLASNLKSNFTYYWKVASVGFDDNREWSDTLSFTSGKFVSVEDISDDGLNKLSIYPNPANTNISVQFQSPIGSQVSVKIFDILGKEASTIHNGQIYSQNSMVNFNLENFKAGNYRIVLNNGGKTISVPLIIAR